MTSLQPIDLVGPVCDNHFRSQSVVRTNSFGGKRTDFHERAVLAYVVCELALSFSACRKGDRRRRPVLARCSRVS
jgi:hypothetical protein